MVKQRALFTARRVEVARDLDVLVAGVAENADGTGKLLLFQLSTKVDDQDAAQDMDTYCLVDHDQQTVYGGIRKWRISKSHLLIELTDAAARALALPNVSRIELEVDQGQVERLDAGLRHVVGPPGDD